MLTMLIMVIYASFRVIETHGNNGDVNDSDGNNGGDRW